MASCASSRDAVSRRRTVARCCARRSSSSTARRSRGVAMSDNEQLRADLARVTAALATSGAIACDSSTNGTRWRVHQRDPRHDRLRARVEQPPRLRSVRCRWRGRDGERGATSRRDRGARRHARHRRGRTVPPSAAEMAAKHGDDGGSWLVTLPARKQVRFAPETRYVSEPAEVSRLWWCEGALWVPVRDGRPCAWPVVEVSRG